MDCCDLSTPSGACFDETHRYRYALWRRWDPGGHAVLFIMLNPSSADETLDDPTIRRCLGFARAWGYGALLVANVFAFRTARPADLASVDDPVGGLANQCHLTGLSGIAADVVLAWGVIPPPLRQWPVQLPAGLGQSLMCLGLTKAGYPRHPLYVGGGTPRVPFSFPDRPKLSFRSVDFDSGTLDSN